MDKKPILVTLNDRSYIETAQSKQLREEAIPLVKLIEGQKQNEAPSSTSALPTSSKVPDTLYALLNGIIKPLFSRSQHHQLTSSGRVDLVSTMRNGKISAIGEPHLIPSAARFGSASLTDNPPWKNGWSVALLIYILKSYSRILFSSGAESSDRFKAIESHIPLLTPPILHQLDDIDVTYKSSGFHCLRLFCDVLIDVRSDALKRTGLMDVFAQALKTSFPLLPTLTPEEDSLVILRGLYPAWKALVDARFVMLEDDTMNTEGRNSPKVEEKAEDEEIINIGIKGSTKTTSIRKKVQERGGGSKKTPEQREKERELRQSYLTTLLRDQLVWSLSHLYTGMGAGGTSSVPLSTFLFSQIPWIIVEMKISAVMHLEELIPMLRRTIVDPFIMAAPELLMAALDALQVIIQTCWPRIREQWWRECFRSVVGGWMILVDDGADTQDKKRKDKIHEMQEKLKLIAALLEDVVGDAFTEAIQRLLPEEPLLLALMEHCYQLPRQL